MYTKDPKATSHAGTSPGAQHEKVPNAEDSRGGRRMARIQFPHLDPPWAICTVEYPIVPTQSQVAFVTTVRIVRCHITPFPSSDPCGGLLNASRPRCIGVPMKDGDNPDEAWSRTPDFSFGVRTAYFSSPLSSICVGGNRCQGCRCPPS